MTTESQPGRIDQLQPKDPPWLAHAFSQLGQREVPGARDNPQIVQYLATTSMGPQHDETPWCSAFVNWCFKQAGVKGTGLANARSWLKWGLAAKLPQRGCVVVLNRKVEGQPDIYGHACFYLGAEGEQIVVIGGNQADKQSGGQVSIARRPRALVLGYRVPMSGTVEV